MLPTQPLHRRSNSMTSVPQIRSVGQARDSADCVIVTRFNLPSAGAESLIRAQEGWLRNRIGLFEQYCLPSVLGQTDRSLSWIVYLDPQSPEWLLDRMRPLVDRGVLTVLYRESVTGSELAADIGAVLGPDRPDYLLTVNLDNDDALAIDFVERLRRVDPVADSVAIYFTNGLARSSHALYFQRDRSNAFGAVRERWMSPRTCWADWHILLGRHMPVQRVGGAPAWLQVVHGQNVSNRVRGRIVHPARYQRIFPGALDDLPAPQASERAWDLLVARPARFVREAARSAIKGAMMRVLGKDGWGRAKHVWRVLRSAI